MKRMITILKTNIHCLIKNILHLEIENDYSKIFIQKNFNYEFINLDNKIFEIIKKKLDF